MTDPLLSMADVNVSYTRNGRTAHVLHDVTLAIPKGGTLGLVGESGAGKSTIANTVLGVAPVQSGTVTFDGRSLVRLRASEQRALTAEIQMVFQDPLGSLNPMRTIGQSLADPLVAHGERNKAAIARRIAERLDAVGMPAAAAQRFPTQFSGGQLQRIAIARALMLDPRLIILDEPVSALDLSVQAQVLNLLADLQALHGLSYLFISHDIAVVRHLAQEVAVIEAGHIVERGPAATVLSRPAHPYTQRLIDAVLLPDPVAQRQRHASE